MNGKFKKIFSAALSTLIMGCLLLPIHASGGEKDEKSEKISSVSSCEKCASSGAMSKYQLLNASLYINDVKKLKEFLLASKKTKGAVEILKINSCPVKKAEDLDLLKNIETLEIYSEGFHPDLSVIFDGSGAGVFNFDKVLGRHGKNVKIIKFKKGSFCANELINFLKLPGISDCIKDLEIRKNCINFEVIITDKEGKKIKFDVAYGYLRKDTTEIYKTDSFGAHRIRHSIYLDYDYKPIDHPNKAFKCLIDFLKDEKFPDSAILNSDFEHIVLFSQRHIDVDNFPLDYEGLDHSNEISPHFQTPYGIALVPCDIVKVEKEYGKATLYKYGDIKLKSIIIPSNVAYLDKNLLGDHSELYRKIKFEEITVSKGVKYICDNAFDKYLKVLYLPDDIMVSEKAFTKCDKNLKIFYKHKEYGISEFLDLQKSERNLYKKELITKMPLVKYSFEKLIEKLDKNNIKLESNLTLSRPNTLTTLSELFKDKVTVKYDSGLIPLGDIEAISDMFERKGIRFYYLHDIGLKILFGNKGIFIKSFDDWGKIYDKFEFLDDFFMYMGISFYSEGHEVSVKNIIGDFRYS